VKRSDSIFSRCARLLVLLAPAILCSGHASRADHLEATNVYDGRGTGVRVGVLGLFHPREFVVSAVVGHALVLRAGRESIVLDTSGLRSVAVKIEGAEVEVSAGGTTLHADQLEFADRQNEATDFVLEVPGKIARPYHGTLHIKAISGSLVATVTLDLETAVASVVAAESTSETPPEALKALAIAARSFFVAGRGRHTEFDFCDTTHCQFLRAAPDPHSAATHAIDATRGLVLAYNSKPFAAMYTRSCAGKTRTPAELGIQAGSYPYYPVECAHCRENPSRWTSRVSADDALALEARTESVRLAVAHRLGWAVVPSNDYSFVKDGQSVLLKGVGMGHGIGLCQAGARAMAASGANFREILQHYYPNTTIISLSTASQPDRNAIQGQ